MESVRFPLRRTACSQAILMSIRTQRMRPGRISLKDLRSREPMDGLSSLPMNHYNVRKEVRRVRVTEDERGTHIVEDIARVTTQGQQRTLPE